MAQNPSPSARPTRTLPARPSLEHLKNEAKQHLKVLRKQNPQAQLAIAQLAVARDYGFASWRQLKAHVDGMAPAKADRKRVFDAARTGDIETVRRAFEAGFDPGATDDDGRSIHQIAKQAGHEAIELLAREFQERATRPPEVERAINAILDAAENGRADELARLLDAHPDLIDARGGNHQKQTALHKAAWRDQRACVRLLLERGADVRHPRLSATTPTRFTSPPKPRTLRSSRCWSTRAPMSSATATTTSSACSAGPPASAACARTSRSICCAMARSSISGLRSRSTGQTTSALHRARTIAAKRAHEPNEHHRTALHHAAAKNRPQMVRLLLDLGADPNATDATGATPLDHRCSGACRREPSLDAASRPAPSSISSRAFNLKRYDLAEAMLREIPRVSVREGRDTIALHLSREKKNDAAVRWLIAHGVDVNAKRVLWDCNYTALHMTAANGAVDIARLLLDAGGDPNIHDDKYDATVLGWAEYCNQPQVAELIRERGEGR